MLACVVHHYGMIPKSGCRFSGKDHALTKGRSVMMTQRKVIVVRRPRPMPKAFAFPAALILALCLSTLAALHKPAPAQPASTVGLLIVLAVDVSGSVDRIRFELQREGYAAAFRDPHVLGAIQSGPSQAIAVAMMQWTGPALQVRAVGWSRLGDEASAKAFADAIQQAPRALFGGGTSISGAIDGAQALLFESPYQAARRLIDISGDGSNNRGRPVTRARDEAVNAGVGINGLPILALEPDLDRYYEDNVIGGPGAFVIAAKDYESFADAIRKKLITEIAQRAGLGRSLARADRPSGAARAEGQGRFPIHLNREAL
jgi:hypothetical protein